MVSFGRLLVDRSRKGIGEGQGRPLESQEKIVEKMLNFFVFVRTGKILPSLDFSKFLRQFEVEVFLMALLFLVNYLFHCYQYWNFL